MAGQPDLSFRISDLVALLVTGATALFLVGLLVSKRGDIEVDLGTPLNLFGLFYLAYYPLGNWIAILSNAEARRNGLSISLMTALGLACFVAGLRLTGFRHSSDSFKLSSSQRRALLIFCKITMVLLIWYYCWHISIGAFYTHVEYKVDTTVFAGLMESGVAPLQLPLVLVLGLILRCSSTPEEAQKARRLLYGYGAASIFIYAASSQFRPLAATLLFTIASTNIAQKCPVKLRTYVAAGVVAGFLLAAIIAVRSVAITQDWSKSDNQLADSVTALSNDRPSNSESVQHDTFNRMLNQQNLLSHIIDEIDVGHPYLYGDLLVSSAYSVIPRAVWPMKPAVTPMQLMLRVEFNLPAKDDSVGPLLEAYANGGWLAVVGALFSMGILTGWLTSRAAKRHTIASVLIICWWWSIMADLEQELLLALLSGLRMILLAAFITWLLKSKFLARVREVLKALLAGALLVTVSPAIFVYSGTSLARSSRKHQSEEVDLD